jgi:hypothetical protein
MLFDGRVLAQNGWFVVRSLLPAGRTGKVLSWIVEPHAIDGWIREAQHRVLAGGLPPVATQSFGD